MKEWTADIGNDPDDDYNLIMEMYYDGEHVAAIKQHPDGSRMTWYPKNKEFIIPVDWLMSLFDEVKKWSVGEDSSP